MKYRIFISDFDGTLVRADGTVSPANIAAIAKYRAAGGIFAICTGRMTASIRPRLYELGLTEGVLISFQGARITDIATGRLLKSETFRREDAIAVLRPLEAEGRHIHVYAGEKLYANRRDELLEAYEQVARVKATVIEGSLADMVSANKLDVVKILTMQMPEEQQTVRRLYEKRYGDRYAVACSSEWLVEIMPKDQTKAVAVKFLSSYYGVPAEEIAAIGDQENDLPLLSAAGGRFAVANAVEKVKEFATVVPSVEEDGVAYAIGKYALGERI